MAGEGAMTSIGTASAEWRTMPAPTNSAPVSARQPLSLSRPDAFLDAVSHLVGLPPRNSVVLVGLAPDESGPVSNLR